MEFRRAEADGESFSRLRQKIYEALIKLYSGKTVEDFEIQRKAATVTFGYWLTFVCKKRPRKS